MNSTSIAKTLAQTADVLEQGCSGFEALNILLGGVPLDAVKAACGGHDPRVFADSFVKLMRLAAALARWMGT